MVVYIFGLLGGLALILYACELFTNGIEWFGKKLNMSQGVIGSVLAAVGTALPETMIPIIAILFSKGAQSHEIGIGAIAGAPFMLTTLAFFVTGLAVVAYSIKKKRTLEMNVDTEVVSRDLGFFLLVYTLAVGTAFIPSQPKDIVRIVIALILMSSYAFYVYRTFKDEQEEGAGHLEELTFSKYFGLKNTLPLTIIQVVLALVGIVAGAHFFVENMEHVATILKVDALILSLIITPIATELPEKFNSIIWVGKKKDTLALGNITGAMVFQSCFPVAFGVVFTPWHLENATMVSAAIALSSALINYIYLKITKKLNPFLLLLGGAFYSIFLIYLFIFGK